MRKILLFSIFLILGLIVSQILPNLISSEVYSSMKYVFDAMLYICLAFIMINVGREFELNKKEWRSYRADYLIAMATAAFPWIFICIYYMMLLPDGYFQNWDAWKENLLLSRFAAPTSAGILFTMLAGAGLKNSWIYKKTQVLAIFDDLDTILLMIPLQILMIGMKWQLGIIVLVVSLCLYIGWKYLSKFDFKQSSKALLLYSVILVAICQGLYMFTKKLFGADAAIHIEVLLPAFILGMIMRTKHSTCPIEAKITTSISYFFMLLVGISTPLFIGVDFSALESDKAISAVPAMSWGEISMHVIIVTALSNLGKMFPLFFYRDRAVIERLALSIGMFTRGEVGAGIIFIAIGYNLGGPLLIISLLTIVLNLLLTGIFVIFVKKLALKAELNQAK
ncbi:MAG: sodium:proton antiporter [Rikenellaceae bacterium]